MRSPSLPLATAPIGVFDSGVGGIGVLREVKRILPREDLSYFGDTANAPYGERGEDEIAELVLGHAARLLSRCKALVLACNTATAVAAAALRRAYPALPIIGMEPALKPALSVAPHPRILVLATAATLAGGKYADLQERYAAVAEIFSVPAPGLVRLVETGETGQGAVFAYLAEILAPFVGQKRFDAVVLGCTHFPFLRQTLSTFLGDLPLFEGSIGTAGRLAAELQRAGLLSPGRAPGRVEIRCSDSRSLPLCRRLFAAGY